MQKLTVETGDIIFFGADKAKVVNEAMGALGYRLLKNSVWLPIAGLRCGSLIFRCSKRTVRGLTSLHHPFTAPSVPVEQLRENPSAALSRAMIWC